MLSFAEWVSLEEPFGVEAPSTGRAEGIAAAMGGVRFRGGLWVIKHFLEMRRERELGVGTKVEGWRAGGGEKSSVSERRGVRSGDDFRNPGPL
jgi:hypothetical protein